MFIIQDSSDIPRYASPDSFLFQLSLAEIELHRKTFSLSPVINPFHTRMSVRVLANENTNDADLPSVSITMLGAGQEVGRSCCVIKHRGKTVVCDVGLHPANNGLSALPFIDEVDWSEVDAILVTQ